MEYLVETSLLIQNILSFLYSHQYRLTLDSKAKQGQVKGFVVNPRKDDVKVFDFSENDDQVS